MDTKIQNTPLVSVVMAAYNAERFIEKAIRSVMEQTYSHWELWVIDDCSLDNTRPIVRRLAEEDTRIHLLENPENLGAARTRNQGLDVCNGAYVALLDSDDLWYPQKLERQIALAEQTEADILYCSYAIIDENDQKKCNDYIVPESTDFDAFLAESVIGCSMSMLSRTIVDRYRFTTDFYHEDLALWLRLLQDGFQALGIRDVLGAYRVMPGTRASNKVNSALNRWRILRKYLCLPFCKSSAAMVRYMFLGVRKYRNVKTSV